MCDSLKKQIEISKLQNYDFLSAKSSQMLHSNNLKPVKTNNSSEKCEHFMYSKLT